MKKKIFVLALIVMCLSIVAYGTLAFFSYEDTATNVIVAGNVRITLHEWQKTESGELKPFDSPIDVLPGIAVSKIVQVENTGSSAAWVRISVQKAIELAQGIPGETDPNLFDYDLNAEYWTERNGYYYYNVAVQPGQTTQPLFTQVKFAANMSNMYQQSKAILTIHAQGVQAANNGTTVFEAAGWPDAE